MCRRMLIPVVVLAMVACPGMALAGAGAYVVDDASITPAGRCQWQSWAQWLTGGQLTLNALPACSTGPVEWSLGASVQDNPFAHQESPAIKWMIRDPDKSQVGLAVNVGATVEHDRAVSKNGYFATTWTPDDAKRWSINADLGTIKADRGSWKLLVGAGLRYKFNDRLSVIAERLQPWNNESINQLGLRWRYSRRASVDVIAGKGSAARQATWFTVGWNITL